MSGMLPTINNELLFSQSKKLGSKSCRHADAYINLKSGESEYLYWTVAAINQTWVSE